MIGRELGREDALRDAMAATLFISDNPSDTDPSWSEWCEYVEKHPSRNLVAEIAAYRRRASAVLSSHVFATLTAERDAARAELIACGEKYDSEDRRLDAEFRALETDLLDLARMYGEACGELLKAQLAEQEADDANDALTAKIATLCARETCACSYDRPGDVCMYHSPQLAAAEAQNATLAKRVAEVEAESLSHQQVRGSLLADARRAERRLAAAGVTAAGLIEERTDLRERTAALEAALKPFARLAGTWTVEMAAMRGDSLTVSNGRRMCAIKAMAFVNARATLASTPTVPEHRGEQDRQEAPDGR